MTKGAQYALFIARQAKLSFRVLLMPSSFEFEIAANLFYWLNLFEHALSVGAPSESALTVTQLFTIGPNHVIDSFTAFSNARIF